MSQTYRLLRLTDQQLPEATAMVGRAFHRDPFSCYAYADDEERARRLPLMFNIALRYTLRYGEVTTTPGVIGAACWLPPASTTVHIPRLLRIGSLPISLRMGLAGLARINGAENYMQRTHKRCIAGPHWYLWVLGVEPTQHGQGIGGALLRAGLERADADSLPCYLETMNPANVPLYQKFGFAIAHEDNIPGSKVHLWSMLRPSK